MNNRDYEKEINLKKMLYKVVTKWRSIVLISFILAVIIGGVGLLKDYNAIDSINMSNQVAYDEAKSQWEERYDILTSYVEEKKNQVKELEDYNASILFSEANNECFVTVERKVQVAQLIASFRSDIQTKENELLEIKKVGSQISVARMTVSDVIRKAIKRTIIILFGAAIFLCVFYALMYLFSEKVQGNESLPHDLYVIGELPRKHKRFSFIDKMFACWFGIDNNFRNYEETLAAIANNMGVIAELDANNYRKVALVSDIETSALTKLGERLNELIGESIVVVPAGDINFSAESVRICNECDAAVIVCQQDLSKTDHIIGFIDKLAHYEKKVICAIITEVDSRE